VQIFVLTIDNIHPEQAVVDNKVVVVDNHQVPS
jgi:hypothetical protein